MFSGRVGVCISDRQTEMAGWLQCILMKSNPQNQQTNEKKIQ